MNCLDWASSLTVERAADSTGTLVPSETWCEFTWGAGKVIAFTHWHAFMDPSPIVPGSLAGLINSGGNQNILTSSLAYLAPGVF